MNALVLLPALQVVGGVLVLSGVAKVREPDPARALLSSLALPSSRLLVRTVAVCETTTGALAVAHPAPIVDAALALLYLTFAGIAAALLLTRVDLASCGCFGPRDTPPSWLHVAFNLGAAFIGVSAAVLEQVDPLSLIQTEPALGFVFAAGVIAAVALSSVLLAQLPPALSAYTRNAR